MPTRPDDLDPLIVTAQLDECSFATLDRLRRLHFPAALNKVPAHVSLFHQLPGGEAERVLVDVADACAGRASFDLVPTGVRFLGHGVAFSYAALELDDLRARLARGWSAWLTAQDRQAFRPHVTIQNKVAAEAARRLFGRINSEELPACRVEGVAVWRYRGGPWDEVAVQRFRDAEGMLSRA